MVAQIRSKQVCSKTVCTKTARTKMAWLVAGLLALAASTILFVPGTSAAEGHQAPENLARALVAGTGAAVMSPDSAAKTSAALADSISAEALEQTLWRHPERIPAIYRTWGAGLVHGGLDEPGDERLLAFALDLTSRRAERVLDQPVQGHSAQNDQDLDLVLAMLQLDPPRFFGDEAFRRRVASSWRPLRDHVPASERLRLVERLAQRGLDDFDILESVAVSWQLVERSTADRRRGAEQMSGDELGTIEASFFSLPRFLGVEASAQLLVSVHRSSPERRLLVLADSAMRRDLLAELSENETLLRRLTLLPTLGVDYSPWPRDPLTLVRRRDDGGLHVVMRGNVQRGREADRWMGRALIQGLPPGLDERWGRPTWDRAELPFHNGQILDAGGASWVSVHSLEPRILELLGTDRLPVDRFATKEGRRYVEAARTAAKELAELRGRPVRFVHALPADDASAPERAAKLNELAGGAGIDLDSILTLLPSGRGKVQALVADVDLGTELLGTASTEELTDLGTYGLTPEAARSVADDGHASPAARTLDLFLERIAEHLRSEGLTVRRLPLLWVDPQATDRSDRESLTPFLVTWNNVVLEQTVAEGFASGFPRGDEAARRVFEPAGFELRLHPTFVESIVRNGGFRCASQQVRGTPHGTPHDASGSLDTPEGAF